MKFHINRKQIVVNAEIVELCQKIKNRISHDFNSVESGERFQTKNYSGGYEPFDEVFVFNYFENKVEYNICFEFNEVDEILSGKLQYLDVEKSID